MQSRSSKLLASLKFLHYRFRQLAGCLMSKTKSGLLNIGAALGSGFGGVAGMVLSQSGYGVTAPAAYALVGVAGMLAANCQVPLTAVLLLFELTHDYFIIVSLSNFYLSLLGPFSPPVLCAFKRFKLANLSNRLLFISLLHPVCLAIDYFSCSRIILKLLHQLPSSTMQKLKGYQTPFSSPLRLVLQF